MENDADERFQRKRDERVRSIKQIKGQKKTKIGIKLGVNK